MGPEEELAEAGPEEGKVDCGLECDLHYIQYEGLTLKSIYCSYMALIVISNVIQAVTQAVAKPNHSNLAFKCTYTLSLPSKN